VEGNCVSVFAEWRRRENGQRRAPAGRHPVARAGLLVGWRPGPLGWSPCGR
jgi:hypothetical protein